MKFALLCIIASFCSASLAEVGRGLNPKNSSKALNLLTRGGVTRVYTDTIVAEVQNLNCNVDRVASSSGKKADATSCSGVAGSRKLALSGEKAAEMYSLLETIAVAQNLPAADSIEVKKMSCRFSRRGGANCTVIK